MECIILARLLFLLTTLSGGIFLCSNPASADQHVPLGNELLVECQAGDAGCYAYLLGVWDGLMTAANAAQVQLFCSGGPVNGAQLRLVYIKWASANPQSLSLDRSVGATSAFFDAFDCPKQSKP
jgi:hypothetical protein